MSSPCCTEVPCGCTQWLESFCDFETVTHTYCGVETVFEKCKSYPMQTELVRPDAGIHQQDRMFFVSRQEQDVESAPGAVIETGDGEHWQIYAAEYLQAFCTWKLWGRNVATCFSLTNRLDIWDATGCEGDCQSVRMQRIGTVRGKILATGGQRTATRNSDDMRVRWQCSVERWTAGAYPLAHHRISTSQGMFRVVSWTDGGPYVPFTMVLELMDV